MDDAQSVGKHMGLEFGRHLAKVGWKCAMHGVDQAQKDRNASITAPATTMTSNV